MIRRRRRSPGIPFGLDSFLDLIANVVGVIIRMILVVWVGARSYHALMEQVPVEEEPSPPPTPALVVAAPPLPAMELPPLHDPLEGELQKQRRELEQVQLRLLEQLRQLPPLQGRRSQLEQRLAASQKDLAEVQLQRGLLEQQRLKRGNEVQQLGVNLAQLRERSQKMQEEIAALEKLPVAKKELRYRTPVSRPVEAEELLFECRHGRVSFIDIEALVRDVKDTMREKGELLRRQWEIREVTHPVGGFRLRYTVARRKGQLDAAFTPDAGTQFSYGLDEWVVEPLSPDRGETLEQALRAGSIFRQVTDGLLPRQTVVTFCVYPDSFALFRQLRDHLYQRDVEVAGRPLPEATPIRGSRYGSRSLGQ